MAQIGNTLGKTVKEFIDLAEKLNDYAADDLAAGSTYWAKDTKVGYMWDGTTWSEV